jgi:NADH-ubiquinone oxidoreductase chain 4
MSSQIVFINKNNSVFFCFIVLILCLVLVGTFIVNNLILFYILFEISLIPTLVVILGWGYQPERLQAGIYMMIYTIRSSLPFLLGLIYVYYRTGTLFIYFPFSLKSDNLILEI